MTEFQMLISWIATIGGFIVAVLVLIENRKSRKEKRYWIRREQENKNNDMKMNSMLRDFKDQVKEDFEAIVERNLLNYTTIEKNDTDNKEIKSDISDIRKELELHNKQFNEYQKQRIATDIMKFADALRSGEHKARNSFKHITESYEIYKRLGGNHYIDEEWKYIKEVMKNEIS